eukprot:m.109474 g.109474  ORF g.109474 m.109474 type:complete len:191 (+) comp14308_c0_seq2:2147-2719(+)
MCEVLPENRWTPAAKSQWEQSKKALAGPAAASVGDAKKATMFYNVKKIEEASHPARGQKGMFAAKNIVKGSFVVGMLSAPSHIHRGAHKEKIEYIGQVVTDEECSATSDYTMRLRPGLAIDGERMANDARYINDYRGIGERASVELREATDRRGLPAMAVYALRDIRRGEEILLNYGKGFWQARAAPAQE